MGLVFGDEQTRLFCDKCGHAYFYTKKIFSGEYKKDHSSVFLSPEKNVMVCDSCGEIMTEPWIAMMHKIK